MFKAMGGLPPTSKMQIIVATDLYQKGDVRHIIMAGSHRNKDSEKPKITEAAAYKKFATKSGVPEKIIFTETNSLETIGNILFTKNNLLEPNKWHSVVVIPTCHHSVDRIKYILKKVLGSKYIYKIVKASSDKSKQNTINEALYFAKTKEIIAKCKDGNSDAIYNALPMAFPNYRKFMIIPNKQRNKFSKKQSNIMVIADLL